MGRTALYDNKSLKTYEKITNNMNVYCVNQLYHNVKYNKYFFINSKGYLHCYIIENKQMTEYMLTKDNDLKYVNTVILITENDKKNFIEYLQNAIDI